MDYKKNTDTVTFGNGNNIVTIDWKSLNGTENGNGCKVVGARESLTGLPLVTYKADCDKDSDPMCKANTAPDHNDMVVGSATRQSLLLVVNSRRIVQVGPIYRAVQPLAFRNFGCIPLPIATIIQTQTFLFKPIFVTLLVQMVLGRMASYGAFDVDGKKIHQGLPPARTGTATNEHT